MKISCGEDLNAKVYFSSKPGQEFDLHYHVISKGVIFKAVSISVSAGKTNALTSLVGEAKELSASESNSESESKEGKVLSNQEIIIPIDYKVSPSMKLIVLVNDINQTLTDFHTYDVEACQNGLNLKCTLDHQSLSP